MAKEKVYIVVSHKHSLKSKNKDDWQTEETVEFVNQLRKKHTTMSSVIGDYLNRKMLSGSRYGVTDYDKFESYIREKYAKQLAQLDAAYRTPTEPVELEPSPEVFVDSFGNVRPRTVFDV